MNNNNNIDDRAEESPAEQEPQEANNSPRKRTLGELRQELASDLRAQRRRRELYTSMSTTEDTAPALRQPRWDRFKKWLSEYWLLGFFLILSTSLFGSLVYRIHYDNKHPKVWAVKVTDHTSGSVQAYAVKDAHCPVHTKGSGFCLEVEDKTIILPSIVTIEFNEVK